MKAAKKRRADEPVRMSGEALRKAAEERRGKLEAQEAEERRAKVEAALPKVQGRPKVLTGRGRAMRSIYLDVELDDKVVALAYAEGTNYCAAIRKVVSAYFTKSAG